MTHHTVTPSHYETPPPSSLCPACQTVEIDARQYRRGPVNEILYACDNGHEWLTRWVTR